MTGAPWSAAHPADLNSISERTPVTGEPHSGHAVAGSEAGAQDSEDQGSNATASTEDVTHGVREDCGSEQRASATRNADADATSGTDVNSDELTNADAIADDGTDNQVNGMADVTTGSAVTLTRTVTARRRAHETLCREGGLVNGLLRLVSSRRSLEGHGRAVREANWRKRKSAFGLTVTECGRRGR